MIKFHVISIFPNMFSSVFKYGLLGNAVKHNLIDVNFIDLRKFSDRKDGRIDDRSYGGNIPGMILRIEPVDKAINSVKTPKSKVILIDAGRTQANTMLIKEFSKESELILICGHYEGIDERIVTLCDYRVSIGNIIYSGGEIPAICLIDAITRFIPGTLGNSDSLLEESYDDGVTSEYVQYTKPVDYKGLKVPDMLLSGDHKKIQEWRKCFKKH